MSSKLRIEIPKGVNPDLQEERTKPSFNVEKLADKLNGGPAARKKRNEIGKYPTPFYFLQQRFRGKT